MWTDYIYLAERFGASEMRILQYCLGISLVERKTNQQGIGQEVNVMSVLDRMKKGCSCLDICAEKKEKQKHQKST